MWSLELGCCGEKNTFTLTWDDTTTAPSSSPEVSPWLLFVQTSPGWKILASWLLICGFMGFLMHVFSCHLFTWPSSPSWSSSSSSHQCVWTCESHLSGTYWVLWYLRRRTEIKVGVCMWEDFKQQIVKHVGYCESGNDFKINMYIALFYTWLLICFSCVFFIFATLYPKCQ